MPHEIEQFANGEAAFVTARQSAWHQLGTVLEETFTAEQAMQHAHLGGWNVRKVPLTATVGEQNLVVPDKYATVRDHPIDGTPNVLGVVGSWYEVIQNEEHAELLNTLVDESGAHFETAGSLRGGREVFVTMKLPKTIKVGGVDDIDVYIAALNSHDGSSTFRLLVTPIRIVCANTQAAALRNNKASYSIRHTTSATKNIQLAREALQMTFDYLDDFSAEAERMINATMREVDFVNKARKLIPMRGTAKTARAEKAYGEKISLLRDLYTSSGTNEAIRGTRWAGYQAITEYLDHFSPVRGENRLGLGGVADVRAEKVLTKASFRALKERAFAAFAAN